MAWNREYYVYIMASRSRVLYIGVTGFLMQRVLRHKREKGSNFASKYRATRLVHFESFQYVNQAIARETELKAWIREKKVALIVQRNPAWEDLADGWGENFLVKTAGSSQRPE